MKCLPWKENIAVSIMALCGGKSDMSPNDEAIVQMRQEQRQTLNQQALVQAVTCRRFEGPLAWPAVVTQEAIPEAASQCQSPQVSHWTVAA